MAFTKKAKNSLMKVDIVVEAFQTYKVIQKTSKKA